MLPPSAFRRPPALLLVLTTGCFLTPRPNVPSANAGSVISAADIERSGAETMWDALRLNVRYTMFQQDGFGTPERVRRRGSSSIHLTDAMLVLVDDIRVPDIVILEQMPAVDIDRIQVLTGVEATTYYGTNAGDGAILIFTKGS